jgi:hypothetical protein
MITQKDLLEAGWNRAPDNTRGLSWSEWYMTGCNGLQLRNKKHSVVYDDFYYAIHVVDVNYVVDRCVRITEVNTLETFDNIPALLAYMQANGEPKTPVGLNAWD